MKNKYYITTSIDYVNAKPHIGHVLEKVQADALARYHRMHGKETFFLIGTDEHGAKITRSAEKSKKPVEEFVNQNAAFFKDLWTKLNISNDYFIRTTNKKIHWPAVRRVWNELEKKGDLYKKQYEGLYCYGHEAFVTKKDLKKGVCEMHGAKPEVVEEENYFFKLSNYVPKIREAIKNGEMEIVPKERENEILNLLEKGVEDVSFSRPRSDLKWGIPVPSDKSQTIYVWADALTNYISALGWGLEDDDKFKKFWPADVHVIGKDILRFHAAIWPAMLLSMKIPLPKTLFVHGFISVDGQKMSKSLGNIIDPNEIADKYNADALRYYLLAEIPSTRDGDFSWDKFEARYGGDLASGVGNFLARIVGLGERYVERQLKSKVNLRTTQNEIEKRHGAYEKSMEEFNFAAAIKETQALIAYGDRRINKVKLWELAQTNKEKFEEEIQDLATILLTVSHMLYPIIPQSAEQITKQLGVKEFNLKKTHTFEFKKDKPLFPRID